MRKPSKPVRWTPTSIAVAALAVLAVLTSGWFLVSLAAPDFGAGPLAPPLARPHLDKARLLIAGKRLDDAETELGRALAHSPTSTEAWLTLAYVRSERDGRLSAGAQEALARSYRFDPLGPEAGLWRVRFCYEHWTELRPELRREAMREVEIRWRLWQKDQLRAAAKEVADPAGRLALSVQLAALKRTAGY